MAKVRFRLSPPSDRRFAETFFLVEATSFEKLCLWKEWKNRVEWEQETTLCIGQIGTISRRPIVLQVAWARINGKLVGFWESTSELIDHLMIKRWLAKNCVPPKWDQGTRPANCDAMNFHLCMQAIFEAQMLGE